MDMQGATSARRQMTGAAVLNAFLRSVYNWMAVGLGLTAVVSAALTYTSLNALLISPQGLTVGIVCALVELGLVFYLSFRINKLSGQAATGLFVLYSLLNGVTLSFILMQYQATSVAQAFFTAAGMFAAVSAYGLFTKKDLTGLGSFMFMGLIGLVVAMVINLFLQSTMLELGISLIGVVVFIGLTAYDTQFLKEMGNSAPADDPTALRRGAIMGALKLYLDFINLFIMLLRLLGDRR